MKQETAYNPREVDVRQMFNDIAPKYDFLNHFLLPEAISVGGEKQSNYSNPFNQKLFSI